jgi:peptidoglycan/LPS O-acetylase OafA/YrhL
MTDAPAPTRTAPGPPSPTDAATTGAPTTSVRPKARSLDLIRALAALAVVVFHYQGVARDEGISLPGAEVGDVGVQVFFVLSGFLITTSVVAPPVLSRRDYFLNRAFRILPLAWFAVVVVVLLDGRRALDEANPVGDLVTHGLLIHGWFPDFRTSIIGPLWTLSIEWQYYLFVLVVASMLRSARARWVVVGTMVVGALAYRVWVWDRHQGSFGDLNVFTKQLPGVADQFALGMLAALAVRHDPVRRFVARPMVRTVGLLVGLTATVGLLVVYGHNTPGRPDFAYWQSAPMVVLWPLGFAAAIAVVIVFVQQHEGRLAPAIGWSGLGFVGLVSYSIYVFHIDVMARLPDVLDLVGLEVAGWARAVLSLVAIVAASAVSYFVVERTAMALRSHLRAGGGLRPRALWEAVRPTWPPPPR